MPLEMTLKIAIFGKIIFPWFRSSLWKKTFLCPRFLINDPRDFSKNQGLEII